MTDERKQAEGILLDVFEMGMDAQEIGLPSFDMIKQTGRIDKMIDSLFALKVAEATKEMYPKDEELEAIEFIAENPDNVAYWSNNAKRFLNSQGEADDNTCELSDYWQKQFEIAIKAFLNWKQNIRK